MTTKIEALTALCLSSNATFNVDLREVESFRRLIRQLLDSGAFPPGSKCEFPAIAEEAEAAGFYTNPNGGDDEVAAAALLEGLLLAYPLGTKVQYVLWPGVPGSTSREWERDVEARRTMIQQRVEQRARSER